MSSQGLKSTPQSFEIITALSKKLTDNAYFSEAKLFNQLMSSEYPQSYLVLEEAGRVAFIFDDFKGCIELNKKAVNLKNTQGQSGANLDQNYCNIGLAWYELQDFNEALNALQQAITLNSRCT